MSAFDLGTIKNKLETRKFSESEKFINHTDESFSPKIKTNEKELTFDNPETPSTGQFEENFVLDQFKNNIETSDFQLIPHADKEKIRSLLASRQEKEEIPPLILSRICSGWEKYHELRFSEAVEILNDALQRSEPGSLVCFNISYLIGRCYLHYNLDSAFSVFQQLIEYNPNEIFYWIGLGAVFGQWKKNYEAFQCFLKATVLWRRSIEAWINIGTVYEICGQTAEANSAFEMAHKIHTSEKISNKSIEKVFKNRNSGIAEFVQPEIDPEKLPFRNSYNDDSAKEISKESESKKPFVKKRPKAVAAKPTNSINPSTDILKNPIQESESLVRPQAVNPKSLNENRIQNKSQVPMPIPIPQIGLQANNPAMVQAAAFIELWRFCSSKVQNRNPSRRSEQNEIKEDDDLEETAKMLLSLGPVKREKISKSKPQKKFKI
ncbi:unnamed protein product [Blepharisma stoltei]|uniref:Uncharacterized protein n=1 Tax=Blepharisma stoltei TaxID=1481888 RepID=A0AAU9IL33_9CILI|nr:unnamed protein product [Blepharisma stoltei]